MFFVTGAGIGAGLAMSLENANFEPIPELKYFENVFVNYSGGTIARGTTIHELLHILAPVPGDDHIQPWPNILNVVNVNQDPVHWSKRINKEQQVKTWNHQDVRDFE